MSSDPLFFNKIVGAILCAGLLAMASGFISEQLFHHETPEANAFPIGGTASVATANEQTQTAPVGPEPISAFLASADAGHGEKLFKACVACHTPNSGGANKVGPNLWNVVGRTMAGTEGYKYSSALRKMAQAWDYESLNQFLFKPKIFIPGTKMTYAGIKTAEKRADLIVYIRSLSSNPLPLP